VDIALLVPNIYLAQKGSFAYHFVLELLIELVAKIAVCQAVTPVLIVPEKYLKTSNHSENLKSNNIT
jgi:hypothetical protein